MSRVTASVAAFLLASAAGSAFAQQYGLEVFKAVQDVDRTKLIPGVPYDINITIDPHQGAAAAKHAKIGVKCDNCHMPRRADAAGALMPGTLMSGAASTAYTSPLGLHAVELAPLARAQLGLGDRKGLLVTSVEPKRFADVAKIHEGDIILKVDDKVVASEIELWKRIAEAKEVARLDVIRKREPASIEIPAGTLALLRPSAPNDTARSYWVGVMTGTIEPALRVQLGLEPDEGINVEGVVPGSPAEKAGLKPNDLLIKIDGVTIERNDALVEQIQKGASRTLKLSLLREGKPVTVSVRPEPRGVEAVEALARFTDPTRPGYAETLLRSFRPGMIQERPVPNVDPKTAERQLQALTLRQTPAARASDKDAALERAIDRLTQQVGALEKSIRELKAERDAAPKR